MLDSHLGKRTFNKGRKAREACHEKFRLVREMSNQTPSIVDCEHLTCPRSLFGCREVGTGGRRLVWLEL